MNLPIISGSLPEILLVRLKIIDQPLAVLLALCAIQAIFIPVVCLQTQKDAEHNDGNVDGNGEPIVLGDMIPKAANCHQQSSRHPGWHG
jgi:hypothetical protein